MCARTFALSVQHCRYMRLGVVFNLPNVTV